MSGYRRRGFSPSVVVVAAGAVLSCAPTRYARGTTDYHPGQAVVEQPPIVHRPRRSYEGLRVAGSDTDLVVEYWEQQLVLLGEVGVFQLFRARYNDLRVYEAAAAEPALFEFRVWCRTHRLEQPFNQFWSGGTNSGD